MDDLLPLDQEGNPVFTEIDELRTMLESGELDPDDLDLPVFSDGDGTENRGDRPRLMVLD